MRKGERGSGTVMESTDYSIPVISSLNASTRYIQSNFFTAQTSLGNNNFDATEVFWRKKFIQQGKEENIDFSTGNDVITLQYGAENVKIGLSKDPFPKLIPCLLAKKERKMMNSQNVDKKKNSTIMNSCDCTLEEFQELLTSRYKQAKKKPPPNLYQSIIAFNKSIISEEISSHNDINNIEWYTPSPSEKFIVGEKVKRLNDSNEEWCIVRPWSDNGLCKDIREYKSYKQVIGDLQVMTELIIKEELNIKNFSDYKMMLIVPDTIKKWELKSLADMFLIFMGFEAVTFIQTSVAATFAAGVSAACVVEIGARHIGISLVEDGMILPDSLIELPFGGIQITKLFYKILSFNEFPYKINFDNMLEWNIINGLCEKICKSIAPSEQEEQVFSQIYDFFVQSPSSPTLRYQFKLFEERYIPLKAIFEQPKWLFEPYPNSSLFETCQTEIENTIAEDEKNENPIIMDSPKEIDKDEIFDCEWKECNLTQLPLNEAIEHVKLHKNNHGCLWKKCLDRDYSSNDPMSWTCHIINHLTLQKSSKNFIIESDIKKVNCEMNEQRILSLDEAISIALMTVSGSTEKFKKMSNSILLIGGVVSSHLLPAFKSQLQTRIVSKLETSRCPVPIEKIDFIASTKDLDPKFVGWKGGAVASRLETVQECWIAKEEYLAFSFGVFKNRLLFN